MNKIDLLKKLNNLSELSSDERIYLLNLVNTHTKYGLVWEDKPEDMEELLRQNLPVLKEAAEKAIINGDNHPNHILIEGDNLHALTSLSFTHEKKIDAIYIDPPYNTGKKANGKTDFKYNDEYVDRDDGYRHSKWLSFMGKRLRLCKNLLTNRGIVFISIDDNEVAQLKMLCDEIFGGVNMIAVLPTIMNLKGNQDQFGFAGTHEYTLVYSNKKENCVIENFDLDEEDSNSWEEDYLGVYKKGANLKATGVNAPREKRPNLYYPILVNFNKEIFTISDDEYELIYDKNTKSFNDKYVRELCDNYKKKGFKCLLPHTNNEFMSWRWSLGKVKNEKDNIIVVGDLLELSVYKKQRPEIGELPSKKPKTLFYKPEYSSGNGTAQLVSIFGSKVFNNPKPAELIKDFFKISTQNNSIILDFFAGSGTTLHAAMQLNAEDGGNRQCILVTNNENNICEEVTYERNKRVIQGYKNSKGENVEGLARNNLRYYKTEFVPSEKTEINRRRLTNDCTEILQIKEDCYNDITDREGFDRRKCRVSSNRHGKYLIIVFYSREQKTTTEKLREYIAGLTDLSEKIRVYSFSSSTDVLAEDLFEVADQIVAVPLPDAIYNAYKATFKTIKLDRTNLMEESSDYGENDSFSELREDE